MTITATLTAAIDAAKAALAAEPGVGDLAKRLDAATITVGIVNRAIDVVVRRSQSDRLPYLAAQNALGGLRDVIQGEATATLREFADLEVGDRIDTRLLRELERNAHDERCANSGSLDGHGVSRWSVADPRISFEIVVDDAGHRTVSARKDPTGIVTRLDIPTA